jgi:hypothetical protein
VKADNFTRPGRSSPDECGEKRLPASLVMPAPGEIVFDLAAPPIILTRYRRRGKSRHPERVSSQFGHTEQVSMTGAPCIIHAASAADEPPREPPRG